MRVRAMTSVVLWSALAATGCGGNDAGAPVSPGAPGLAVFQRAPADEELFAEAEFEEEEGNGFGEGEAEVPPAQDDGFGVDDRDDGFGADDEFGDGELPPPADDGFVPQDDGFGADNGFGDGEVPPPNDGFTPQDDGFGGDEVPPPANDSTPPEDFTPVDTSTKNVNDAADTATDAAAAEAAADAEALAEAEAADMDAYVVRDTRCRFGAPDPDGDGLCDALERQYGTDPRLGDTDEDGLSDGMEVKGYRVRRSRDTILLPNANPLRRDVYVQINYVEGWRPTDAAIEDVRRAFAEAPNVNADGSTGIDLHVEIDDGAIVQGSDYVTFPDTFMALKPLYFKSERAPAYHWALFARQHEPTGSSGRAYAPGVDLIVTLGVGFDNSQVEQAGTFMHELGHNLGLPHGGLKQNGSMDEVNFKPNYLSVMSYTYQTRGVIRADGNAYLDYSRATTAELVESQLFESNGFKTPGTNLSELGRYGAPLICASREDGNCSQFAWLSGTPSGGLDYNYNQCLDDAGPVVADLDALNGPNDTFALVQDDWTHLDYGGGGVIGNLKQIGARVRNVANENIVGCVTAETSRAVSRVVVDTSTPPLCGAIPNL